MFAAIGVVIYGGGTLVAQQPPCRSSVLVTALDEKSNEAIDGLTASSFQASLKSGKISIDSLAPPPIVRRFVFVVDRSSSIIRPVAGFDAPPYDSSLVINQALKETISEMPDIDQVAFLVFNGRSSTRTEFMHPESALAEIPGILKWEPPAQEQQPTTPLWDNIDSALRMLNPRKKGDVIVVVSDGGNDMSRLSRPRIQDELLRGGVPLLAILVAKSSFMPVPETKAGASDFAELAEATGGAIAPMPKALQAILPLDAPQLSPARLISLLGHQYELVVDVPPLQKPVKWQLDFKSMEIRKKTRLFYPRYLSPCTTTQ